MACNSKNVYVEKLDHIIYKYYNRYHRTIKTNYIDVQTRTYIDFDVENNDKEPKFEVGDVRI